MKTAAITGKSIPIVKKCANYLKQENYFNCGEPLSLDEFIRMFKSS